MVDVWKTVDRVFIPAVIIVGILLWLSLPALTLLGLQPELQVAGAEFEVPTRPPDVVITLYGGELPGGARFGFGFSPDNITSPGPTIVVKQGQVVEIRFVNVGKLRHAFAVVERVERTNPRVIFGAQIASAQNPIPSGAEGSVVFVASQPGTFFYQCPVSNHGPKGMWGQIIVTP